MELPFPDGSFARVVCRYGLQLLSDRARALREMHRVLAHGGEVDVEVPGPIERNPTFAQLANAFDRADDLHRATRIRWLFCMPEPDDLRGALAAAGFEEIRVEVAQEGGGDRHGLTIERNRGRAVRAGPGLAWLNGLEPPGVCGELGHVTGKRDDETGAAVLAVLDDRRASVQLGELLDE